MPSYGELVPCTTGGWMVYPPSHCPNGHRLSAGQVLVGHQPCGGLGHHGHMSWECLQCNAVRYAPGVGAGCSLLDGAARVR